MRTHPTYYNDDAELMAPPYVTLSRRPMSNQPPSKDRGWYHKTRLVSATRFEHQRRIENFFWEMCPIPGYVTIASSETTEMQSGRQYLVATITYAIEDPEQVIVAQAEKRAGVKRSRFVREMMAAMSHPNSADTINH